MLGEAEDGEGGTAIVEEAEVFALEAGDELTVLVGDGEDEIDFVGLDLDGRDGLVGRGSLSVAVLRGGERGRCGGCLLGRRGFGDRLERRGGFALTAGGRTDLGAGLGAGLTAAAAILCGLRVSAATVAQARAESVRIADWVGRRIVGGRVPEAGCFMGPIFRW